MMITVSMQIPKIDGSGFELDTKQIIITNI